MSYGQLSYTVPGGWANADDAASFYNFVLQDAYAKPASDETAYPGISLVADAAVHSVTETLPGLGQLRMQRRSGPSSQLIFRRSNRGGGADTLRDRSRSG